MPAHPSDRLVSTTPAGGIELLRARFAGRGYERHRHDTYTICVTDSGLQAFDYRGAARTSAPGQVVVLHPDEPHDGRAGSAEPFAYRSIYVSPARIADAVRDFAGPGAPLPFVADPVVASSMLAAIIAEAFQAFPAAPEPLAVDAVLDGLARGLAAADPAFRRTRPRIRIDEPALARTRDFLDAAITRVVGAHELETVSGLDRFALARQFRRAFGTSPYRYLLMRRLDWVRGEIRAGGTLAAIAARAGFADQPHLTRMFKAAYGLSPAQYRAAGRA